MKYEMSDRELVALATNMRDRQDIAGLLHLNAVLTASLFMVVGRRKILRDLTLAGEDITDTASFERTGT